jgi:thioredoxin reductase (NADPH)
LRKNHGMKEKVHKLIIIGSGPAGLTAAIYAARANLEPLIIEGSEPGGQLMGTTAVENWPGNKSILGPTLMMNMREHAEHFNTQFVAGNVTKVDFKKKPFTLSTDQGMQFQAHTVIIATGAVPHKLGCPGEAEYWGKGVTTCAICDGAFYPNKKVLIVGGGDTAMEDASFMKKFTTDITIVQIHDKLTASYAMQQRVINDPDIKIIYHSTVSAIKGNGTHVTGVTITDQKTKKSIEIAIDGIFIAIGLKPSTNPFQDQLALTPYGYLCIENYTKTSVPGIFAAGDVSDDRYKQAITSAGIGCMAALDAERYLKELLAA